MKCNSFAIGTRDVGSALSDLELVVHLAWGDIKARYRRSILGPFWIVLSTAVSVAGLGILWSTLLKQDPHDFVPSLTAGLVFWHFLAACISEAPSAFFRNAHFIRNLVMPYFVFPMVLIIRQTIIFAHNLIVVAVVFLWFDPTPRWEQWLVLPGMLLVFVNLGWIVLLIAIFGARFRDLEQIIGALMPLIFFLSPVLYRPSQLSFGQLIVWINPFSYLISLVRDPAMGSPAPWFVYATSAIAAVLGWLLTIWQFGQRRDRIPFWM